MSAPAKPDPKRAAPKPDAPAARAPEPGFSTLAIHAGQEPDPQTGAVSAPVYQTSTYAQEEIGKHKGYEYARTQNPTRERLERNLSALEGGTHGLCFASGTAAIGAILHLFSAGDHVVASNDLYGGTYRLFDKVLTRYGLSFSFVDVGDLRAVEAAVRPETRLLYVETPTNPLMKIADLTATARLARERKLLSVVDNTFMTPVFQRPLSFGVDVVVHSVTKYLNGHSDLVGGAVVTSDDGVADRLRFLQNAVGAVPGPWDCWLTLRGTRTLALRMERHDRNGRALAAWLEHHAKVRRVYYPGLASHPQHELARQQMSGFGGMIAVDLGSLEAANRFVRELRVFTLAESLGGVESLACHPATMTHASVPREMRLASGLTDGLVRLSVGCEDIEDLQFDLERSLEAV
jgi:cystathionine beta-lyase/cystathionine gamma-synthase